MSNWPQPVAAPRLTLSGTARVAGWFIFGNIQVWQNRPYNETELLLAKEAVEGLDTQNPDLGTVGCDPDLWTAAKNYLIVIYCFPAILCCCCALPTLHMPPASPLTSRHLRAQRAFWCAVVAAWLACSCPPLLQKSESPSRAV